MNNNLVNKLIKRTAIVSLLIIGIMVFLIKDFKPAILGYIFGTATSILGFKLLHNTIEKAVNMLPAKASTYSTAHYIARYTIYAVVLIISILADYLNFLATFFGLMMIKVIILLSAIFDEDFQN